MTQADSKRVLGIVGSYRKSGAVNTVVSEVLEAAKKGGAQVRLVYLSDYHIEFCTNCRQCMQPTGATRVACAIHEDDTEHLLREVEQANAVVIGAPVNLAHVNALTQRFLERCVGFGYWPWGTKGGPKIRAPGRKRKAVLVCSSGAPAFMNSRLFGVGAVAALKRFARLTSSGVVETIRVGMVTDAAVVTIRVGMVTDAAAVTIRVGMVTDAAVVTIRVGMVTDAADIVPERALARARRAGAGLAT